MTYVINWRRAAVVAFAFFASYVLLSSSIASNHEPPMTEIVSASFTAQVSVRPSRILQVQSTGKTAPTSSTLSASVVAAVRTLPHPSCAALDFICENVASAPVSVRKVVGAPKPTPVPLPPHQEYWREYSRPEFNCYKHGGHYNPGLPRQGVKKTFEASVEKHLRRVEAEHIYYWDGDFYFVDSADNVADSWETIDFSAYFPMVAGNWPQPVVDSLPVKRVSRAPWPQSTSVVDVPLAYFQPPTDFLSVYHVAVETIFPLFHTLLDSHLIDGDANVLHSGISILTSRPRYTAYAFKSNGCTQSFEACLDTVWGRMYLTLTVASSERERRGLLDGSLELSTFLKAHQVGRNDWSRQNATSGVYGLDKRDQQFRFVRSSSEYPFHASVDSKRALHLHHLFLGNPTHCEPLWGGDPHYAEALAQRQSIRGSYATEQTHVLSDIRGNVVLPSPRLASAFNGSFASCQRALRAFRTFFVTNTARPSSPLVNHPIAAGRSRPVRILFTSRKGDWARQLLDEDDLISLIRRHIKEKGYHPGSEVRVVKFHGTLSSQLHEQLNVEETTIFIGNHGANLLNSIYLRPNAGLITLSLRNPGFYPFSLFPDWLHVRDMVVEQMCNRRLNKGKCRWMEGNNNDMYLSDAQRRQLLAHVDGIIAAQDAAPRR